MITLTQKASLSFWLKADKKIIVSRDFIREKLKFYLKNYPSDRDAIKSILNRAGYANLSQADDLTALGIYEHIIKAK